MLTANNSYSGASMTVSAGTLVVSGSIRQFGCNPNGGAMLAGSSVVGAITINPGGVFTAGANGTRGTMTVAGKPGPLRRRIERMRGANSSTRPG